jgi:hypothetical protein
MTNGCCPGCQGSLADAQVRTLRTPGDTVDITHFSVFGGWVLHQSQAAFFFDRALNTLVTNVATEGEYGVAPYMVQNSYLMTVLLGEAWQDTIAVVSNDSHAITFESPGPLDAKRFVVDETSDVSYRSGSEARYYPSLGDPTYSVAIEANYACDAEFPGGSDLQGDLGRWEGSVAHCARRGERGGSGGNRGHCVWKV